MLTTLLPVSFAEMHGSIAEAGGNASINISLKSPTFTFVSKRITIGLLARGDDGGAVLDALNIVTNGSGTAQVLRRGAIPALGGARFVLASLAPGNYSINVGAADGSTGAFTVEAVLAGDINGDGRVTAAETRQVSNAIGAVAGSQNYFILGDLNIDNKINRTDANLVNANNGARTTIKPLTLQTALDNTDDPNADNDTFSPDPNFSCASIRGAKINIDTDGDGSANIAGVAAANGVCNFNSHLAYGANSISVTASDAFGQSVTTDHVITRHDVVLDFNAAMLQAIRTASTNPPAASRFMAMTQTAVYDAVNNLNPTHQRYAIDLAAPAGASDEAAAAAAAHRVLTTAFAAQSATFDTLLADTLADIADGQAKTDGQTYGAAVADAVIALRANDGSATAGTGYVQENDPGDWQPTPPAFSANPLLPGWGNVTPFALTGGGQFVLPDPPALTSEEYTQNFNYIKTIGKSDSLVRTPDQTAIARFWANGGGTATPPGHWNIAASIVAKAKDNGLAQNARLFAQLNVAMADAAIATWHVKYEDNHWRPVTAIRAADTDGNDQTTADANWLPLIGTPPFPAYTSGHSAFSASAAKVLAEFFGSDQVTFVLPSENAAVGARTFTSFTQAAQESADSRAYGGIHWVYDDEQGLNLGRQIGDFVNAGFFNANP